MPAPAKTDARTAAFSTKTSESKGRFGSKHPFTLERLMALRPSEASRRAYAAYRGRTFQVGKGGSQNEAVNSTVLLSQRCYNAGASLAVVSYDARQLIPVEHRSPSIAPLNRPIKVVPELPHPERHAGGVCQSSR